MRMRMRTTTMTTTTTTTTMRTARRRRTTTTTRRRRRRRRRAVRAAAALRASVWARGSSRLRRCARLTARPSGRSRLGSRRGAPRPQNTSRQCARRTRSSHRPAPDPRPDPTPTRPRPAPDATPTPPRPHPDPHQGYRGELGGVTYAEHQLGAYVLCRRLALELIDEIVEREARAYRRNVLSRAPSPRVSVPRVSGTAMRTASRAARAKRGCAPLSPLKGSLTYRRFSLAPSEPSRRSKRSCATGRSSTSG